MLRYVSSKMYLFIYFTAVCRLPACQDRGGIRKTEGVGWSGYGLLYYNIVVVVILFLSLAE